MSATTVQLSGGSFQDVVGNPLANGTLVLSLSQDGAVNSDAQLGAGAEITILLDSDGNVSTSPAQYVWPNDVITPANTFYNVSAYSANGQLVWGPNAQQILSTPSPFNIGAWIPAEVNTGTSTSGLYVELNPDSGQQITLNTNGTNYLSLLNNSAGASASTALVLTNGTSIAEIAFTGTGASSPNDLAIANAGSGGAIGITSNGGPLLMDGSSLTVNAPINYSTDTGTANNYILNVPNSVSAPVSGQQATFIAANSSTGACTLVWHGSDSPVPLVKNGSTALTTGDIIAGAAYTVFYNGTVWELMNSSLVGGSGAITSVFGRTGVVVADSGDYTVAQITGAAPLASPTFTGTVTGPTINATSGFEVAGVALASANLSDAANLGLLNATQTFSGTNTFSGDTSFTGTACSFNNTGIQFEGTTQLLIQGSAAIRFDAVGTATSSSNKASTPCQFYASYWDGVHSVATTGEFIAVASPASGSNPVTTLGFTFYPNASPPSGSGTGTGAYSFDSPVFAPTATAGTNTTQVATTAFVTAAVAGGGGAVSSVFTRTGAVVATSGDYTVSQVTGAAPLASPTFTGTPAAPTASGGTNTTQIATTAFVTTALGSYLPLTAGTGNVITGEIYEVNPASSGTVTLLDISNSAGNWAGLQVQTNSSTVSFTSKNQYDGYSSFMSVNPSSKPSLIPNGGSVYMFGLGFSFATGIPNASSVGGFFQASASGVLNLSASSVGTSPMTLNVIGTVKASAGFATGQTASVSTATGGYSLPITINGTTMYIVVSATP